MLRFLVLVLNCCDRNRAISCFGALSALLSALCCTHHYLLSSCTAGFFWREKEYIRNTRFFVFFLCQLLTNEARVLEVNGGLSRNQIFIQSLMLIPGMSMKFHLSFPNQFIYVVLLGMRIRFSQQIYSRFNATLVPAAL